MNSWVERPQGKGKDKELMKEESIGRKGQRGRGKVREEGERSKRKGKGQKGEDRQRRDQSAPRSSKKSYSGSGDPDVGEGLPGEGEMTLYVLADDGLLVVTGHVVPLDPVTVEVVQHRHA
jgi:hypothetical protein